MRYIYVVIPLSYTVVLTAKKPDPGPVAMSLIIRSRRRRKIHAYTNKEEKKITDNNICRRPNEFSHKKAMRAMTCDFQQCGILTSVDSDEHVQPHCKLRKSICCLFSSLTVIEYSSH